jgi:unsaturated rhamnogalacturonyl hydrolase
MKRACSSSCRSAGETVRRFTWLFSVAVAAAGGAAVPDTLPEPVAIQEAMQRADDYFIAHNSAGVNGWARSVYETGNMRAYESLGLDRYLQWAIAWGNQNLWKLVDKDKGPTNADSQSCGQTYLDLYEIDPQPVRIAALQAAIDERVANPVAVQDWWWVDGFYMSGSVYARFGRLSGASRYFDKLWLMFDDMKTRRGLFDSGYGLWYRDEPAKTAVTKNGQKQFWGRGNGWAMAGLARVIEQMPPDAPHRNDYVALLQRMAAALKPLQGSDGLWRASLLDAAEVPNPETSCSGFFTFALAWGIRNGCLSAADYESTVARAWNGLVGTALHSDGKVGYVQASGRAPAAATYDETYDYGVGAFLLAGGEVYWLATPGSTRPAIMIQPSAQTLEAGGSARFVVAATGTPPLNYQWRCNGTNLAEGSLVHGVRNGTLTLSNAQPAQAGNYSVVVSNATGQVTSFDASLMVSLPVTLAEALDTPGWVWTTSGSPAWAGQASVSHDGMDAAQSGAVKDGKTTSMQTKVTGPGLVSFWWKVSSETNKDLLLFYVGGKEKARISGEADWRRQSFSLPSGTQVLKWTYSKNSSKSKGQDRAWVDQVQLASSKLATLAQSVEVATLVPATMTLAGGKVVLTWPAKAGRAYEVFFKGSLADPEWKAVNGAVRLSGDVGALEERADMEQQRFYQVIEY